MSATVDAPQPDMSSSGPPPQQGKRRTLTLVVAAAALLMLLAIGIIPRIRRRQAALDQVSAAQNRIATVSAVRAQTAAPTSELTLPANALAVSVASIYARSNGYIRERYVDIGSKVKAGQLLAVIETPELDQELEQGTANLAQAKAAREQSRAGLAEAQAALSQARANLREAESNEEISRITNTRWQVLVAKGVIPKQSGDERRTDFDARRAAVAAAQAAVETGQATVSVQQANLVAAEAAVEAQQANVRRLEHLRAFERVVAPFDGVITERKIEKGDLITAGSGSDRNLFSIAQPDVLRVQVNVPQTYSVDITPGDVTDLIVQERPGEIFSGRVIRTADALDTLARTLLTEIYVENKSGRLLPGMYSQVRFHIRRSHLIEIVPTDTLIIDSQGMRLATVTSGKTIHFVQVEAGRDLGANIEITNGLHPGDIVVSNPSDSLEEGQQVEAEFR
ncbi:MAG: efflux RND transporter periplasmic adaptor subunit [Acidobacteriaceae bacterium]|nr:efflux RND transporter periplasmic adaptor subunit [Acidobacteriaceae bacterium]